MSSAELNSSSDSAAGLNWPDVQAAPLIVGGSLIGIGAAIAAVGVAVAATHLISATRQWISELETPPSQLARLKWEQAKTAAASGAATWRDHPNAQVGLSRRAASQN
jgi:hypothetical protein